MHIIDDHLTVDGLVMFAKNTGECYEDFLALARADAPVFRWQQFICATVFKVWDREHASATAILRDDITEAAAQLKAYYVRHIAEF